MSGPILTHFDASNNPERYCPYYLYSPLVELRFVSLEAKSVGTRSCDFSLKTYHPSLLSPPQPRARLLRSQ